MHKFRYSAVASGITRNLTLYISTRFAFDAGRSCAIAAAGIALAFAKRMVSPRRAVSQHLQAPDKLIKLSGFAIRSIRQHKADITIINTLIGTYLDHFKY